MTKYDNETPTNYELQNPKSGKVNIPRVGLQYLPGHHFVYDHI